MKYDSIIEIVIPNDKNAWITVLTEEGAIEIRIGGARRIQKSGVPTGTRWTEHSPGARIIKWVTDEEWVYMLLSDGSVISHGFGFISDSLNTNPTLTLYSPDRFNIKYAPNFLESVAVRHFSPS